METKLNPWRVTGCVINDPFRLKKYKKCQFCSKMFRSAKAKLDHISDRHNFQCQKCAKTFSFKKDFEYHECQPEECGLCPKAFITRAGLKKHKRKEHRCEICGITYESVQEKLKHESDIESDYYCFYCQTSFCSKDAEYYMCMDKCNRGYYGENESEDDWFY